MRFTRGLLIALLMISYGATIAQAQYSESKAKSYIRSYLLEVLHDPSSYRPARFLLERDTLKAEYWRTLELISEENDSIRNYIELINTARNIDLLQKKEPGHKVYSEMIARARADGDTTSLGIKIALERIAEINSKYDTLRLNRALDLHVQLRDSFLKDLQSASKRPEPLFRVHHTYRAKNAYGAFRLGSRCFVFDSKMKFLVSYDDED